MLEVCQKFSAIAFLLALGAVAVCAAPHSADFNDFNDEKQNETERLKNKEDYRLPESLVPEYYDINLDVDEKGVDFFGVVSINIKAKQPTKEIVLHKGSKLYVEVLSIIDQDKKNLSYNEPLYNNVTEKLTIPLEKSIKQSDIIVLTLSFDGTLQDNMIGFYRSTYFNTDEETWLAATQFQATHARHAFPCFDEPALKAKFKISIAKKKLPKNYECLSNMEGKIEHGKCVFKESVPMSTYLVAFVISDFEAKVSEKKSLTPVKIWTRPGLLDQATYASEIASKSIKVFNDMLNEPYLLPKMDLVAVPDFSAGAMENWGLLTFREANLLYDEQHSANVAKQRIASVIVHECAHMWFGNLVTPQWWGYLWLSEGFARYYQYMATAEIEKDWKMEEQFVVEQHQSALGIDALEGSKPMSREGISSQSEIGKMGDSVTYNKGASILRMIEQTLGAEVFNAALKDYLKNNKLANATPNDLWKAFQKHIDKDPKRRIDVAQYMKSWTEKPGFPYVEVDIKPDHIKLSQRRFFLQNLTNVDTNITWSVPITWISSATKNQSTKPVFWLTEKEDKIPNDNKNVDWLILNAHSAGFYRVLYDDASWQKIINTLTNGDFSKIPVLNRAAIVDDLLNLARAELIDYDTAFSGLQYLKKETEYLPFKSAFTSLDHLIRKSSSTPDYEFFKEFVTSLFSNVYKKLTYNDQPNDKHLTILLRQEINNRACSLDHPECIANSKKYFKDWKENKKVIPKNQRSAAYCTAIKHGTFQDWNFLWEKYIASNVAAEQITILSALGCSKNSTQLEKHLLNALNPSYKKSHIRKQDVASVFSGVYSASPQNAEYMLDFIEKHYEDIHDYHKNYDEIGSLVSGVLKNYPTKKIIGKVLKMIESNPSYLKTVMSTLKKSVDQATVDLNRFNEQLFTMTDWIKKNTEENTVAYRLPEKIIPSSYAIHLTPHFEPNFTFDGRIEIKATVAKDTNEIVLHTDQLTIKTFAVSRVGQTDQYSTKIRYTEKYHFTTLELNSTIEAKTNINIIITYTGKLNTEMRGFYRSSYKVENTTKWLAATHLEPVGARRVFPCFDEPGLKATFDITVVAPKDYKVISNTELIGEAKNNVWTFKTTPLMSTYLMAVVVSDFGSQAHKDEKCTYAVWSNPRLTHQLNYSLEVMKPIVDDFESRLKVPYQLPKLDMVALPDFSSGAMENWGLITFRETNMLYDPEAMSSLTVKQSIRNVIAHEIAHQWFGNLVSPLWWDYLWLNEGFARYFQYFSYTKAEESWNLETQFVVDHLHTAFSSDALRSTHPITHKVYSPSQIRAIFDTISYAKAGSIIRMIEKLIGSKAFYNGLNSYLENSHYSTGTPELLYSAFEKDGKLSFDVSEVLNSWTLQPGYPVINIDIQGNITTLNQTKFYLKPKCETKKSTSPTWLVPLSWTTGGNPDFNNTKNVEWLKGNQKKIIIENANKDWVIFNVQQMGFYRVNYDKSSWQRIFDVLSSDKYDLVHEINRAAIVDDLLNLGRAGQLSYDVVLTGIRYLRKETEYAPWKAAQTGFTYLGHRFAGRPLIYSIYRTYVLELLEPIFKRLEFDDKPQEKHTDQLLRKLVLEWLCSLNDERCVNKSIELFRKQQNDSSYNIPPNQKTFVYCTAIRHTGNKEWNYLKEKFEKSDYATEKITILSALGCSQNPDNLKSLLGDIIKKGSEIRLQDAQKAFNSIIDGGLVGVETTMKFIQDNYKQMKEYFGDDSVTKSVITTLSKRLSTVSLVDKFKSFIADALDKMPSIRKSLQTSLKAADYELKWYNDKYTKLFESLVKLSNNPPGFSYRLPNIAKPKSYEIYLTPYFAERNFTFDGKTTIKIEIIKNTHIITLNTHKLNIEKIYLTDNEIIRKDYNKTTQQLTIYFKHELVAKKEIDLIFEYTGQLRADMRGFYRSSYVNEKGETRWLASTQFEPTYARSAFPCFDEPSFKATFKINIYRPENYHTLSNMGSHLKSIPQENSERVLDQYDETVRMSSYLVAFVVSDFVNETADGSMVKVWARSQLKNYCTYASALGGKTLTFLGNKLNYDYVLKEMNFVSLPDFDMGAMENWGLVTFREYGLSYDIHKISATYRRYVNTVVSHELVHMWFGNLVTLDWWDFTWLNEGFAEYLSYIASDDSEKSWELLKQFVVNELHVALDSDSAESSHPMNNKVLTPTDIQAGFDKIAYQKSASVLRMLHHSFGEEAFFSALQQYMKSNDYRNTRPEHLIAEFEKYFSTFNRSVTGEPEVTVTAIINSWVAQAGYPVVTATRANNSINFNQERFLISSNSTSTKNLEYWVPITFTTETEKNFETTKPNFWLGKDERKVSIESNDTWFIVNIQETGYYRVNYDKTNWESLINVLNSDKYDSIPELNRAQLIDDSLNLARADYIDYDIALNVTSYLSRETNYFSWKAFFNAVAYLSQRIEGQPQIKQLYATHVLTLLSNAYEKLGFKEDTSNDSHLDQLTRELILTYACKYGHRDCVDRSTIYFHQESVTPNIASAVYCTAIEHGSIYDWNTLWEKFSESVLASDYITILKGLGCSKDRYVLEKYLDLAFDSDSKIRRQDLATVLSSVYTSSKIGLRTAINYYKNNTDKLHYYYGNWDEVGSLFKSLAGRISTKEEIDDLKKSISDSKLSKIKSSLDSAIKTAEKNLAWSEKHLPKIRQWFEGRYEIDEPPTSQTTTTEEPNGAATISVHISIIFIVLFSYFILF